jgi:hypothetical protein
MEVLYVEVLYVRRRRGETNWGVGREEFSLVGGLHNELLSLPSKSALHCLAAIPSRRKFLITSFREARVQGLLEFELQLFVFLAWPGSRF